MKLFEYYITSKYKVIIILSSFLTPVSANTVSFAVYFIKEFVRTTIGRMTMKKFPSDVVTRMLENFKEHSLEYKQIF